MYDVFHKAAIALYKQNLREEIKNKYGPEWSVFVNNDFRPDDYNIRFKWTAERWEGEEAELEDEDPIESETGERYVPVLDILRAAINSDKNPEPEHTF